MGNKIRISKDKSIYELVDLDLRIIRCLGRHGIKTIGDLVALEESDILKIRGIGINSLWDIQYSLSFYDVVEDVNYDISKRINQLLDERHISMCRLARATGITITAIQNWKYGIYSPSVKSLIVIADYFGVTLDYLCGRG